MCFWQIPPECAYTNLNDVVTTLNIDYLINIYIYLLEANNQAMETRHAVSKHHECACTNLGDVTTMHRLYGA